MKAKILISVSILVILYTGYRVWNSSLFAGAQEERIGKRVMNVKTGYQYYMEIDRSFRGWPVKCRDTGTMDCYAAEVCYWNQCGKIQGGTWAVLKQTQGIDEATTCPLCGHAVVGRNPLPPGTFVDRDGVLHQMGTAQHQPTDE